MRWQEQTDVWMVEDRTGENAGFGGILSPSDVAKLRAKVFNTPEPEAMGAEEPARAFVHDTPGQNDSTPKAALRLVNKDDDALRGNIASQLRSLIAQTNNHAERAALEAILERVMHNHGKDLREALSDAKSAISGGAGSAEADTPEEKTNKAIAQLDKAIDEGEEKLKAAGYYDEEYEKWLKREKAKLATLEENSPEYRAQQVVIAQGQEAHARQVQAEATARGDTAAAQTAGQVADAARDKQELAKSLIKTDLQQGHLEAEALPAINTQVYEPARNNILASLENKMPAPMLTNTAAPNPENDTKVTSGAGPSLDTAHTIPAIAQTLNNSGVVVQPAAAQSAETSAQPAAQLANMTLPKPVTGKSTGLFG